MDHWTLMRLSVEHVVRCRMYMAALIIPITAVYLVVAGFNLVPWFLMLLATSLLLVVMTWVFEVINHKLPRALKCKCGMTEYFRQLKRGAK
jgi:hypothetical protein